MNRITQPKTATITKLGKTLCSDAGRSEATPTVTLTDDSINTLSAVLNHVSEAIILLDMEGQIELANPAAAHLLGANTNGLIGRPWWGFLSRPDRNAYHAIFNDWKADHTATPHHGPQEALIERADGSFLEVDLSLSGIPSGQPKLIAVLHDLTSHKAEYQELRRLARTDSLTGLANRRAFDEAFTRHWRDCNTANMPLSVILLDVDHFKHFNDRFGHVQGDYCLAKIAEAIESALPSRRCLAARYGGEEFAVILPGCSASVAQSVAHAIQLAVSDIRFDNQGLPAGTQVTVSLGLASHKRSHFRHIAAMISAADTALYQAKQSGRNKVVTCGCCIEA